MYVLQKVTKVLNWTCVMTVFFIVLKKLFFINLSLEVTVSDTSVS